MQKILYIIILLFISNCSLNKVVKHHGVHFLEKKQKNLKITTSNKNDIVELLGPPSTKSEFDNDLWIYIERKNTKSSVLKLGKKKVLVNNVLVLEIDSKGLLVKKEFYDMNDMNQLKFSKDETTVSYQKDSFVYNFLASMRQKINDPLGKRKVK